MDKKIINKWSIKIKNTIFSDRYIGCEINGDLYIALVCAKMHKKPVFLYGNMDNMDCFVQFFKAKGIKIDGIIERTKTFPNDQFWGIHVFDEERFIDEYKETGVFIFSFYQPQRICGGLDFWGKMSIDSEVFFIDRTNRYIITNNSVDKYDKNRIEYYRSKIGEIIKTLPCYCDEKSFCVLNEYLRTYIERDVYRLTETPSEYKYFFDDDGKPLYTHQDNEVFLNFGASTGDSVFGFFDNGLKAKRIIAIEADCDRYNRLRYNINLLPRNMREIVEPVNIFVDKATDLDDVLKNDEMTLINADIEGAELDMLHVLNGRIKKDRPVMAICLYHLKEDIVEIPNYILSIDMGYRFKLRKYSFCWCNISRNEELVLYAIPDKRSLNN